MAARGGVPVTGSSYSALVVDGGNLLWRAAYAAASHGGCAGDRFLEGLVLTLRFHDARGVHVCWDAGRDGRRAIFPQYKVGGGSDGAPEAVREDFERSRRELDRLLPLLGARTYEAPGWEADDLCAALALRLSGEGRRVLAVSGDKDLLQLVRRGVHLLRPARKQGEKAVVVHAANWEETSGVPPVPSPREAWLAVQSLWGDPGDNVPGIRGIGEARAKEAVRVYPDVLSRLSRPGSMPALPAASRRLLESREALPAAALSYELVRLRDDLPALPLPGPEEDAEAGEEALWDLGWEAHGARRLRAFSVRREDIREVRRGAGRGSSR